MSRFFTLRSLFSSALAATLVFAAGCSGDDTNPVDNPGTNPHKIPGPGSSYTFVGYNVDSAGKKIPGTDKSTIWTVTDKNLNHKGKTGVVKIVNGTKIGFLYHAPNGDLIGTSDTAGVASGIWVTYPFGSKTPFTYPTIDTTVLMQGGTARIRLSGSATYLGEEDVVVNGETIRAQKVLDKFSQVIEQAGIPPTTLESENTLWYSPKIGYFVKQHTVASTILGTFAVSARTAGDLTSYSLK